MFSFIKHKINKKSQKTIVKLVIYKANRTKARSHYKSAALVLLPITLSIRIVVNLYIMIC